MVDLHALSPVEQHGGLWLKRDDLFELVGHRGGKVRTCWWLAQQGKVAGHEWLVTAGSRHSPQVAMVAAVGKALGLHVRVHVPTGPDTPELVQAALDGADVLRHKPGHNSVIVARAKADAKEFDATYIPFGMEHQAAVDLTSVQVGNLPAEAERLVIAVGSGMSLAGILYGMSLWRERMPLPVLGVVVGANPTKRLDHWAPPWWRARVELVPAGLPYSDHLEGVSIGHAPLDPVYEAKAARLLQDGDVFWLVGHRAA